MGWAWACRWAGDWDPEPAEKVLGLSGPEANCVLGRVWTAARHRRELSPRGAVASVTRGSGFRDAGQAPTALGPSVLSECGPLGWRGL